MAECCSICRDPMTVSETGKVELSCSHEFHLACITRWFSSGGNTHTCPICRGVPKEKETVYASGNAAVPNVPPVDVNAANALAAQRSALQRQRDDLRAQIHLQLNMLDQFSRDIQRMRSMVTTSLNDMDIQNMNGGRYNDNMINNIIRGNYNIRHHDQR
jgi:hypothetical protein